MKEIQIITFDLVNSLDIHLSARRGRNIKKFLFTEMYHFVTQSLEGILALGLDLIEKKLAYSLSLV